MKDFQYSLAKAISKIKREKKKETIINFFRKEGIKIGSNTNICSNIITMESHLIEIGSNTTIAGDVLLVTHDNSISKIFPDKTDSFGRIIIGDNCFIGARSVIMYGVTLGDNVIVAAGSVVCNSFTTENIIIGGNPAKVIGSWDEFREKNSKHAICRKNLDTLLLQGDDCLVKRKQIVNN